ncbi:zinc finger, CCHC-type containing protein [Tanacetum coccineum]|uniref:Zinc finger, CCHC-type containing protein n=1 Tax=Tanacetum coccineum TaxID=301880 RepID=A0ABQ5C3B7_9ASTR
MKPISPIQTGLKKEGEESSIIHFILKPLNHISIIYSHLIELEVSKPIKVLDTGDFNSGDSLDRLSDIEERDSLYNTKNGVAERKNRALKEMVNSMLSYSGLSEGFWGEAMLTACYLLNRVPNKRNKTTPYELWDDHSDGVPSETPEPRKGKRVRKAKSYEAIDDEIGSIMENNTWVLSDLPPGCKPLVLNERYREQTLSCIRLKRENKGIVITQSHYIEKILKKFNREDCSPVSTPMDPVEKLKPNTGKPVDQLEYSRAIGCLMYAMTSTRPDIAYAVGRLSRFTSNPSRQHWQAITMGVKYLKVQ